ncbi:hypothetical protein EVAR_33786_1 [Eumeta japonica]|uniref:Uncharacterized protein n=1 Tax=Eumeta variegata TaxID=151549 RepID=A0A4C1VUE7_EUMVA|nr:hypothetical protein EVAR_33786_1 [Eumeta japonica]
MDLDEGRVDWVRLKQNKYLANGYEDREIPRVHVRKTSRGQSDLSKYKDAYAEVRAGDSKSGGISMELMFSPEIFTKATCIESLYSESRSGEKWIQCISCKQWANENCTEGGLS